jgi:hypothetical protein
MTITLTEVEAVAEQGLALVSQLAPLAALGGPAAGAIGVLVGQVASTVDTLVTQVSGDAAIIATGNLANIQALQAKLQAANETLAAQIAAS